MKPAANASGKGQQREHVACVLRKGSEELRPDDRGQRAIQIEVVPLENGARRRGHDHLLLFGGHRAASLPHVVQRFCCCHAACSMCAWHFGQTVLFRSCPADRLNPSSPWAWRRCGVTGPHCLQKSVPFRLSPSLLCTACQHVDPVQNAFDVETGQQHNTQRTLACCRLSYKPTAECGPWLFGVECVACLRKVLSCVPALECGGKPYANR